MKTANPFQIPTCFQRNLQQRRRERFKKTVVASVAAAATLLVALLIEGCMSEHATPTNTSTAAMIEQPEIPAETVALARPKPVMTSPGNSVAPTTNAPTAVPQPAISDSPLVYLVKPGDTLTRIAQLHRTTVKVLRAVNGLDNNAIAAGARLKLPPA